MNINKLVRWNLTQSLENRKTAQEVMDKAEMAGYRRSIKQLHREIRAVVDIKIREREAMWESL